jgi:hypothetical protein
MKNPYGTSKVLDAEKYVISEKEVSQGARFRDAYSCSKRPEKEMRTS